MDQPEQTSSDNEANARPKSLTERLKAEANGHSADAEDFTPLHMARRFAPEGQTAPESTPLASSVAAFTPIMTRVGERHFQMHAAYQAVAEAESGHSGRGMQTLIALLILVALVPSTILGLMIWQGSIPMPWLKGESNPLAPTAAQQAAVTATLAPATTLPKHDVEVPHVVLSAPTTLEAKAGEEVNFALSLDGNDGMPARSIISVSGLPQGASFSGGRPYGETEWSLRPDEIGDLKLALPTTAKGEATLIVALTTPDGRDIATNTTTLNIAADPKAGLVVRPHEATLIADLIAHGNKMVEVGYFPGARAYFGRAAEAGSAEAALSMGETFDPSFIANMGAMGTKPDPAQARSWYERAKTLGAEGADLKLAALAAATGADGAQDGAADTASADRTATAFAGAGELVELKVSANVRESPASNAKTVRIMDSGTKFRVIGRKGNWLQVKNLETEETGWVYSRFVATASVAGQ
jgi:hypothetical protein